MRANSAHALERPRCQRGLGRGAGLSEGTGEALVSFQLHEASLAPSPGATRHLLPMKEDNVPTGEVRSHTFPCGTLASTTTYFPHRRMASLPRRL